MESKLEEAYPRVRQSLEKIKHLTEEKYNLIRKVITDKRVPYEVKNDFITILDQTSSALKLDDADYEHIRARYKPFSVNARVRILNKAENKSSWVTTNI